MSNFDHELTAQFKDNTNKKIVGKFKDEGDGMVWSRNLGSSDCLFTVEYTKFTMSRHSRK
eukprot:SAG31_NODE_5308_length_2619_cov_2.319048_2_plen_60_part_00